MRTAYSDSAASPKEATPWLQYSVLIVDDEEGMRSFLQRALAKRCGLVETAASAEEAQALFDRFHFDLIILDISLPGKGGVDWLHELRSSGFKADVILITAFADIETAIHALRAGASDFILKPFRMDQILNSIQRCFDRAQLVRENFVLKRELAQRAVVQGVVGASRAIQEVCDLIKRVASMPSTVLLQGESGVGKEVAARALHALSVRVKGPFVPVNCAAISEELIESELFGHVKGAFTGATEPHLGLLYYAQGGTLFLDEIAELPSAMQTKLLRVLEDHMIRPVGSSREVPVDIRVVASTNRNLAQEVKQGRFRQDLYYRLDVVNITIPPLRERQEDILPLAQYFSSQLASRLGVAPIPFSPEIIRRLQSYDWPGNVRELKNLIERSLILGHFPLDSLRDILDREDEEMADAAPLPEAADALARVEKQHILAVLAVCGGNKSEAARRLGISRKTMERRCAQWESLARGEEIGVRSEE